MAADHLPQNSWHTVTGETKVQERLYKWLYKHLDQFENEPINCKFIHLSEIQIVLNSWGQMQ